MHKPSDTSRDEAISKKKIKDLRSTETLFRNALRSNLELTSLTDSKASVLISVNGFILTVIVTASGLILEDSVMIYPFISIMLTALVSILFATMAIRPRDKAHIVKKKYLNKVRSVAYYQDMADSDPDEYVERFMKVLESKKDVQINIIKHLHILGTEIDVKYKWLKKAYTSFAIGLIVSALLTTFVLHQNISQQKPQKKYLTNIYEASAVINVGKNQLIIAEDENSKHTLKLITIDTDGKIINSSKVKMSKEIKHMFKKEINDIEALAYDGKNHIYAITSFTTNKEHQHNKAREHLIRFNYQNGELSDLVMFDGLLEGLKELHPKLKKAIEKKDISRKKEINIEGLAYDRAKKELLIGFRSPTIKKEAILITLKNPAKIFDEDEKPALSMKLLDLEAHAIRGISYDLKKGGFWIIAGDVGKRKEPFKLWYFDSESSKLAKNHDIKDLGFAEGVTDIGDKLFIVRDDGNKMLHKPSTYEIIEK